ncbi:hypothetical protein [Paenibacillus mesophilus]|nr:hypothetical protein [Paenibacillus mesophilus]
MKKITVLLATILLNVFLYAGTSAAANELKLQVNGELVFPVRHSVHR